MDLKKTFEEYTINHPNNWMKMVVSNVEFMDEVHRLTSDLPPDTILKDRVYSAVTGESTICPSGNIRTLGNIKTGWKGCGRAGVCACARELLSSKIKSTKANTALKILEMSKTINVEDLGDELLLLVDTTGLKQISVHVLKSPKLIAYINSKTGHLPNFLSLGTAEKVYISLNGESETICKRGNHKKFNTIETGYRFCSSKCECRREEQARKMRTHHSEIDSAEKIRRIEKQSKTIFENHGVLNPMHVPGALEKIRSTSIEKYGVHHFTASEIVKEKIKVTNRERFGGDTPMASLDVKQKVHDTNLERYGVPSTMHIARAAFEKANNGLNPFQIKEYQEKAVATMIARYGFSNALQNPVILATMIEETEKKWGVPNVLLHASVKAKIKQTVMDRYNRLYPNQVHIEDDAYRVLQDPELFKAMFLTKSLREVSLTLGMSYDGTRKYCDKYGIELPKSSYETALLNFVRSQGTFAVQSDRKVIKPQELDITMPTEKLAIEFCGLYWHGEKFKEGKDYHRKKLQAANDAGYRLITIFEDEWVYQQEICKTRILHIMGVAEKGVGARSTTIHHIDAKTSREFLEMYHIQGNSGAAMRYGAFDKDGFLVAVMTFSKRGRMALGRRDGPPELVRFATDGRNHPGIASKLFAAYVREHNPDEIISYADLRWSEGKLYDTLGFTDMGETGPNYWYIHANKLSRYHRYPFRKDRIKHRVPNGEEKTEREIMTELNYFRIYDCGSKRYVWKRKQLTEF